MYSKKFLQKYTLFLDLKSLDRHYSLLVSQGFVSVALNVEPDNLGDAAVLL